jgi:hypothetical protein
MKKARKVERGDEREERKQRRGRAGGARVARAGFCVRQRAVHQLRGVLMPSMTVRRSPTRQLAGSASWKTPLEPSALRSVYS